jgi:CheY-like chemotaxis protein
MTVSGSSKSRPQDVLNDQAQKLDAICRVAGKVAHDLNNILTIIQNCSTFLTTSLAEDDSRRADAVMIRDASSRAAELTAQLLEATANQSPGRPIVDQNVAANAQQPAPVGDNGDDVRPTRSKEVILIVEDDGGVRSLTSRMLASYGYSVIEATNGAQALDTIRACGGNIDLVITDAMMPVMNGGELAGVLATEYPHVKVLFMSLYTDDGIVRRGSDSRRAFIPKPFTQTDLVRKVREVLDAEKGSS